MVGVQQWAEVRRLHFVRGLSVREIHRRTGLHRETIRTALRSDDAPRYSRPAVGSKLDPFKHEIHGLLRADPKLPGQRVRELIAPGRADRPVPRAPLTGLRSRNRLRLSHISAEARSGPFRGE